MAKRLKIISTHVLVGISVFYFIVHPITMVVYWFEFSGTPFTWGLFQQVLKERLLNSFSFDMVGMMSVFTVLGAVLGVLSGFFWISFNRKNNLLEKHDHLLKRDVSQIIADGETERVEFKSSLRYDYLNKNTNRNLEVVIAKTIAGFMNSKGGKLLIGLDDEGGLLGLQNDFATLKHKNRDGFEREVFRIIKQYLGREACYKNRVFFYQLESKDICLVDVEISSIPIYVDSTKGTTFYVRTGNATYPLSVKETVEYLKIQKQQ
ncbi:helix-turn-helix domain-containing protein [Flagellimonas pacifica]|uniref:Putative DNA-binding domain-containing protein n=1 Tax=Flagellimonas pacifica TaxID=1247520 RepID=A0A285MW04_9FLAO|nr:ATP-binding protein [Allomuricauda parva]SNZ01374.1 Putative DNA-binding domain-containing protein [Allomuricauda parva]